MTTVENDHDAEEQGHEDSSINFVDRAIVLQHVLRWGPPLRILSLWGMIASPLLSITLSIPTRQNSVLQTH